MRRLFLALVGSLVLVPATPAGALGDVTGTAVVLSCSDGHSVALTADATTLTSLTADVDAINASGTGMSCALDTPAIDPTSETTEWTVYDYNPSDRAIAPRNSPASMPATTSGGGMTWSFPFKANVFTALLTTTDPNLTGDLSTKTVSDSISLSGDATSFVTQNGGGDCVGDTPAAVRFYFTSPSASGPSTGTPPAGFYTRFWWSNPMNMQMLSGTASGSITASLGDPTEWSDWNGQRGDSSPAVLEGFTEATQNVQSIGLSFGGECFFETGVTPTTPFASETFSSMFGET